VTQCAFPEVVTEYDGKPKPKIETGSKKKALEEATRYKNHATERGRIMIAMNESQSKDWKYGKYLIKMHG